MDMRTTGPQIAVYMDFENVATSAEANFGDFDVNCVMDLLRTRGRLLIKRAYGDWGRFHRYRRPMMENGIDLIQLYSVGMQQKNRADVRLAIDAIETVFTRSNIDVYAIISGDSDFTELIHKLRDYGKYTIGIGLRSATSDLLRRACDEFIFYETLVVDELTDMAEELQLPDPSELLRRALIAAEQKGESPVFAGRLKQIMLGLDSSFNEANYGFAQFRAFLEAHRDLIGIQEDGLQLYVTLRQREAPAAPAAAPLPPPPPTIKPAADLSQRYRSFLREANLRVVDPLTRTQVVADFIATLQAQPEPISLNGAADLLKDRYDGQNALTAKIAVPDIMRLLVMSYALDFAGGQACSDAPVRGAAQLTSEALAAACEAVYLWRLVEGGVPVVHDQLAPVLYDHGDGARVQMLCQSLQGRHWIAPNGDSYQVAPEQISRLVQREELLMVAADLARVTLPPGEPISPVTAENLFREGSELRQKDFAGSAQRYLQAARVQLEALRAGQARAGFDDLKWYLASFCSVKAGHAFVSGTYSDAIPYYLAFFSLAQESDSVWPRIQRLVSPMSSYFFAIAGKQLDETVPPNLGRSLASQVALRIHNHANTQVGEGWEMLIERLAGVNLGIVRQLSTDINGLIGGLAAPPEGLDSPAKIERTRGYLVDLIRRIETEK
ncbi:MAG TPA: NYN domain-containing protein [Anaerolineae bacterium]